MLCFLALAPMVWGEDNKPRTPFVAIVGNRQLTSQELKERCDKLLSVQDRPVTKNETEESFERYTEGKIVEEWVEIALLAVEAEKRGFNVSEQELEEKVKKIKDEYAPKIDLVTALHRAGYTQDEFKSEMTDALLGEKLIHDYITKTYTETQMRQVFLQNQALFIKPPRVRVYHIFRSLSGTESRAIREKIRKEMEAIRERANKGEDFKVLAKESDALSKTRGGDLGWLTATNRLPEPVNALIFKTKPGKVSKVILDDKQLGYHLIMVEDKKPATGLTFEEARLDVEQFLFNLVKDQMIEQLKRQHHAIINLGGIPESILHSTKK